MAGISNDAFVDFFEKKTDDDLKDNFVGVFPLNYVIRFISFHEMMRFKNKYPFVIMNTDQSDKNGTHWWSFLDLHEKKEILLFDSFGFEGFKNFVIDNDKNVLNKILFGIEKFQKKDQKITLISLKFSMKEYEKIKNKHCLRPTTQDLLHLMYEFGRLHKINDVITVHSVDDQLQKLEKDTCGIFQLYFYFNLFMRFEDSSVLKDAKLSKRTIEKLLNEIFSLDRDQNEEHCKVCKGEEHQETTVISTCICQPTIFIYWKLLAFDRCQIDVMLCMI